MSDLKKRVITAIIGFTLLIAVLYIGGIPLKIAISLISLFGSFEMYNALKKIKININLLSVVIGIASILIFNHLSITNEISVIIVLIFSMMFLVFNIKTELLDAVSTLFTFIYIPYSLFIILNLEGTYYLPLVFVIAFSTDTCAYIIGTKFGKHKLIERVSPNKSIEGAIGGILGCLICSLIYFNFTQLPINIVSFLFLIFASIVSQIGDLSASKIKRVTGIKDFSNLLPGHGGIMDRFDSIIMVIPMVYFLFYMNNLY